MILPEGCTSVIEGRTESSLVVVFKLWMDGYGSCSDVYVILILYDNCCLSPPVLHGTCGCRL